MEIRMKYSNSDYPDKHILTIGKWAENQKIKVVYYVPITGNKEVLRRIYFDGHDLYITIEKTRYYFSEFERVFNDH